MNKIDTVEENKKQTCKMIAEYTRKTRIYLEYICSHNWNDSGDVAVKLKEELLQLKNELYKNINETYEI